MDDFLSIKEINELIRLDWRFIAIFGLLIGSGISLFITYSAKNKILGNIDIDQDILDNLLLLVLIIILLSSIIITFVNYQLFQIEPNVYNAIYVILASILVVTNIINLIVTYLDISDTGELDLGSLEA